MKSFVLVLVAFFSFSSFAQDTSKLVNKDAAGKAYRETVAYQILAGKFVSKLDAKKQTDIQNGTLGIQPDITDKTVLTLLANGGNLGPIYMEIYKEGSRSTQAIIKACDDLNASLSKATKSISSMSSYFNVFKLQTRMAMAAQQRGRNAETEAMVKSCGIMGQTLAVKTESYADTRAKLIKFKTVAIKK